MRTVIAIIDINDNVAIEEDIGTIDYLEREFGWLEQSEIYLRDAKILDNDDPCDKEAIELSEKIFSLGVNKMTGKERIFTKILDCGIDDLDLLDDIGYDMDESIDDLMANGILSLESIIRKTFEMAADELSEKLEENRNDIEEAIRAEIAFAIDEWVNSGGMTMEELEECEEHQSLLNDLSLLENGDLHPDTDFDYYINYLDTHVYMKHLDFYQRWMENELDEIEEKMGWYFQNID